MSYIKVRNTNDFWEWLNGDNRKLFMEERMFIFHPYFKDFGNIILHFGTNSTRCVPFRAPKVGLATTLPS